MNVHFNTLASQLQSRIAKRATEITLNTMWKQGYRSLGRMHDWREAKEDIAELTKQQCLDKALLRLVQVYVSASNTYWPDDHYWGEDS